MFQGISWSGHERNCCYLNTGDGRFANISAASGLDFMDDARACALVDWDHDGDVDLWSVNRTAPQVRMLRNDTPSDHHYLALRLEGRTCNRDAIGARVEVTLKDEQSGNPQMIKTLRAGEGFLSQSSKWLHFGLGKLDHGFPTVVSLGDFWTLFGIKVIRVHSNKFWAMKTLF